MERPAKQGVRDCIQHLSCTSGISGFFMDLAQLTVKTCGKGMFTDLSIFLKLSHLVQDQQISSQF